MEKKKEGNCAKCKGLNIEELPGMFPDGVCDYRCLDCGCNGHNDGIHNLVIKSPLQGNPTEGNEPIDLKITYKDEEGNIVKVDQVVKDLTYFLDEESKKKGYDSYKTILNRLNSFKTSEGKYNYLVSIQPDIILDAHINCYKHQLEESKQILLHETNEWRKAMAEQKEMFIKAKKELTATIAGREREVVFLNEKINEYQNLHRLELEAMGKLEDTIDQQKKEIEDQKSKIKYYHNQNFTIEMNKIDMQDTIDKLTQENESLKNK